MRLLAFLFFVSLGVYAQPETKKETTGESTFTEGMMLFVLQDYTAALRQFETFIKLDEKSAVGYYMKSRTESALNQNIKAELSAETSVNLDKNGFYYLENYANTLRKNNKNAEAQTAFKNLIKVKPDFIEAYYSLLALQVDAGQSQDALKTLEQAEGQFGSSEKITQAKQTILLKDNKVDAALKEGSKQVAGNPEFVLNQAKILINNKREKEAVPLLEGAVNDNPDFVDGFGLLSELYGSQKDLQKSEQLLNKILGNTAFPFSLKANAIGNYLRAFGNENLDNLLPKVNTLAASHPDQSRAFIYSGDVNYRLNNALAARDSYAKAVSLDKNQFEVWMALAQINYRLGDYKRLEKDAEKATMYFPNHGGLWFYLGLGQLLNGNADDAEISLEEALRFGGNEELKSSVLAAQSELFRIQKNAQKSDAALKNVTADNEFKQFFAVKNTLENNPEAAVLTAAKLSERFPQNNVYKMNFAKALLASKKSSEALEALSFIKSEEAEKNFEILETKGDVLSALGKAEEAQAEYRKSLELNKNNKRVQDKLKQL
jgi:predicted Zn-dependent protease